jgi:hypothetical protein
MGASPVMIEDGLSVCRSAALCKQHHCRQWRGPTLGRLRTAFHPANPAQLVLDRCLKFEGTAWLGQGLPMSMGGGIHA